jgi:hypothetical protein
MYLKETYIKVRVGISLPDNFPIENGLNQVGSLSPLLLNFGLG